VSPQSHNLAQQPRGCYGL